MAIDELLYQADRSATQRRTPQNPRYRNTPEMDDYLARKQAAGPGVRTPAPSPSAAAPAAQAPAAAPQGKLAKAGAGLKKLGAAGALAATAGATATTGTERYYERFGMTPKNDGTIGGDLLPNLGIRAMGAASDLGDALTLGIAGNLFRDRSAAGAAPQSQAQPMRAAAAAAPPASGAEQPASERPVYRLDNQFSDQPIAGGVAYKPGAPMSVVRTDEGHARDRAYLAEREMRSNQNMARRDASIDASITNALDYRARENAAEGIRRARWDGDPNSIRNRDAGRTVQVANARNIADAEGRYADALGKPRATATRTPEQEAALSAALQQSGSAAALQDEQAIAAGLQNAQARRAQQVMTQLDQLGEQTPAPQRRALIDRALVQQGKDPDANRFMGIDTILGYDDFGTPKTGKTALDTRTGQILGGAPAVGNTPAAAQYEEGKVYIDAQGNRARYENGKFVPLT